MSKKADGPFYGFVERNGWLEFHVDGETKWHVEAGMALSKKIRLGSPKLEDFRKTCEQEVKNLRMRKVTIDV